jgi:hypothetical protein
MHLCLTGLAVLALLSGCSAAEPEVPPGTFPPVGIGPFADIAGCLPAAPCPGPSCGENATGKADGKSADMTVCATLDLTWTGGTGVAYYGQPDLAIYLARTGGVIRVEAAQDAQYPSYVLIGFIGGTQNNAPPECEASVVANKAMLNFDRCNTLDNVTQIRLTRVDQPGAPVQGPAVDALELLYFKPQGYTP